MTARRGRVPGPRPKGICPGCGELRALRDSGVLGAHNRLARGHYSIGVCKGVDQPAAVFGPEPPPEPEESTVATYQRREVTTRVVEFIVPAEHPYGACWVEVYKAVSAAHQELVAAGRIKQGADAPDDMIRILPGDADVVVQYEVGGGDAVMVKPGTAAA